MVRNTYNMVVEFLESMERLMNFYTAPEAQKNLVEKSFYCPDDECAVKLNGTFTYGVTPCKDYDEKKRQIEKLKKKAMDEENKRIAALPFYRRIVESCKMTKKVKHELKYAPRTLD